MKSTAEQLDQLVSQTKVVHRETVKPGFQPERKQVPPVSLEKIAPIVASRLKVPEKQVARLLKNDREKLSELVLARSLDQTSPSEWQELLQRYEREDLFRLVQERQLTAKVKQALDDLYTELAFVALDAFEKDQGSSPGSQQQDARSSDR